MAARRPTTAWPRRHPDPARSPDPRTRAVVTGLNSLSAGQPMREQFRTELRSQLVAVAPRLVAEGVSAPPPKPVPGRPGRRGRLGRPVAVLATAAAVLVGLLAGAVWLSGRTLPGDSLYGIKRASENVQLSLTSGDVARGKAYLDLARTRAEEAGKLWSRDGAGKTAAQLAGSRVASLITSALSDADRDTADGAQLLTGDAVRRSSAEALDDVSAWTPAQLDRLRALLARVPAGPLHERVAASVTLVQRLATRAGQLRAQLGCGCLATASSDDLGPVPCTSCSAAPAPAQPGHAGSTPAPAPSTEPGGGAPGTAPGGSGSAVVPGRHTGNAAGTSQAAGGTAPPLIPGVAPVPAGTSQPPVANSATSAAVSPPPASAQPTCGLQVSLGPIGLGVGSCGVSVGVGR